MNKFRERAQYHFPTVLLTLASIIQALALELLWSKAQEFEMLWTLTMESIIVWAMISAALLGILQIWVTYSTMVMAFVWRPAIRDSIFPFIIGLQEFMIVSLIGVKFVAVWLVVMASLFVFANYVVHTSFRRARNEPDNEQFFGTIAPATIKDFKVAIMIVTGLLVFALLLWLFDSPRWLALLAILIANGAVLVTLFSSRGLWRILMTLGESE